MAAERETFANGLPLGARREIIKRRFLNPSTEHRTSLKSNDGSEIDSVEISYYEATGRTVINYTIKNEDILQYVADSEQYLNAHKDEKDPTRKNYKKRVKISDPMKGLIPKEIEPGIDIPGFESETIREAFISEHDGSSWFLVERQGSRLKSTISTSRDLTGISTFISEHSAIPFDESHFLTIIQQQNSVSKT